MQSEKGSSFPAGRQAGAGARAGVDTGACPESDLRKGKRRAGEAAADADERGVSSHPEVKS